MHVSVLICAGMRGGLVVCLLYVGVSICLNAYMRKYLCEYLRV